MTVSETVKGQIPLEEIPRHFGGEKQTVADVQWHRVVWEVARHLPFDVLTDLEDAKGELMIAAFEYGTRLQPGDEPLIDILSPEEIEARTGEQPGTHLNPIDRGVVSRPDDD